MANSSEIGRALAALRRVIDSKCERCGQPITGTARLRYCSDRCKVAAWRALKKERQENP